MRVLDSSKYFLFLALCVTTVVGCGDSSAGSNNNSCPDRTCDHDGRCENREDCLWCPDCCVECSMTEGQQYEYIVSELVVPQDLQDPFYIGVNLDGSGFIDNKAGQLATMFPFQRPYNQIIANRIAEGKFILLVRLLVTDFNNDESIAVQVLVGDTDPTHDATEDNLTGSGHALVHPGIDDSLHLCGSVADSHLRAGPGDIVVPYPYVHPGTGEVVLVPLVAAQVVSDGSISDGNLTRIMVGGGIAPETVRDTMVPALVEYLNELIITDPEGEVADFVLEQSDGSCDPGFPGCEEVVNGEGDCVTWEGLGDPNPPLTETEFLCTPLFYGLLRPDVDLDGDCIADVFSAGFMISAIPITIGN